MVLLRGLAWDCSEAVGLGGIPDDLTGSGESDSKLIHVALGRRFQFLAMLASPWSAHHTAFPEHVIYIREIDQNRSHVYLFNNLNLQVHSITSSMSYWSYTPTLGQCGRSLRSSMNTKREESSGSIFEAVFQGRCWQVICSGFQISYICH